jgi:hypothetical protein
LAPQRRKRGHSEAQDSRQSKRGAAAAAAVDAVDPSANNSQQAQADDASQLSQPASQEGELTEPVAEEEREVSGAVVRTRQLVYPSRNSHRQLASLFRHMSACYTNLLANTRGTIRSDSQEAIATSLKLHVHFRCATSSLDAVGLPPMRPLFTSELFYNDKSLFQCQSYSNSMLDLLASLLQLRRDELHTDASAKGFIMGELQYELEDFAEADPNEGGSQIAAAASSTSALLALPPALTLVNCETPQVITPFPQQIRGQANSADAQEARRPAVRLSASA